MDDDLIYVKTQAGEAVLRERTRLIQRNLRMVLIIVDGLATVGELKRRLGDGNMVEPALAELEGLGLIETLPAGSGGEPRGRDAGKAPPGGAEPWRQTVPGDLGDSSHRHAPAQAERRPGRFGRVAGAFCQRLSQWRQTQRAESEEKAFRKVYEMPTEADTIEQIKLKRVRRGPKRVIGRPLRLLIGLAGGILLLALVAMLFPYQSYQPEMERRLSRALRDPVKIGQVHFSFLPYPNLTLERVSVGAEPYATAAVIRIIPSLLSLFAATPILSDVSLHGVLIRSQGLLRSGRWFSGVDGAGAIAVRGVHLETLAVEVGDATVGGLSGSVRMAATGGVDRILLQNAEHTLSVTVVPSVAGDRLSVTGNGWALPFKPGLRFGYLEAEGEITAGRLWFSKIDGQMYEGIINGTALFDWAHGISLVSDIDLKHGNLARLFTALNPDLALEGDISGKLHLESRAASFGGLLDRLRVDGDFVVARGVIKRFDLVEAVRSGRPTRGGYTRFERFSGSLQLAQEGYHLSRLNISSGPMQAVGDLDIDRNRQLRGVMEVSLKGTATLVRGSVQIAGTLRDPRLTRLSGISRDAP